MKAKWWASKAKHYHANITISFLLQRLSPLVCILQEFIAIFLQSADPHKNLMWYKSWTHIIGSKEWQKLCVFLIVIFTWSSCVCSLDFYEALTEQIEEVPFFQSSASVFFYVFVLGSLAVNIYHKFPHPVIKCMPCISGQDENFHQSFLGNKTSVFLLPSGVFLAITSWRRKCKELCSNHNASSFHYSCYAEGLQSCIYIPGGAMASVLFNTLE